MSVQRIGAALLLVTALTVVAGCATTPTANGADDDPQAMANMLTERNIILALADEPSLSNETILVSCDNGDVTLFGHVDSSPMRALAERTVRAVDGVTNVRNVISVN